MREKALLYFQNPAKFMSLAVGKNSITTVDLKTKQTQSLRGNKLGVPRCLL